MNGFLRGVGIGLLLWGVGMLLVIISHEVVA